MKECNLSVWTLVERFGDDARLYVNWCFEEVRLSFEVERVGRVLHGTRPSVTVILP